MKEKNLGSAKNRILNAMQPGSEFILFRAKYRKTKTMTKMTMFEAMRMKILEDYSFYECESVCCSLEPHAWYLSYDDTKRMTDFLGNTTMIGYNTGFAITMLDRNAKYHGIDFNREADFDMLHMARDFFQRDEVEDYSFETMLKVACNDTRKLNEGDYLERMSEMLFSLLSKYRGYVPHKETRVKLLSARLSYNFRTKGSLKIMLKLNCGNNDGSFYYDVAGKQWVVAESIKDIVCLEDIIAQFEKIYLKPFGYDIETYATDTFHKMEELGEKKRTRKK